MRFILKCNSDYIAILLKIPQCFPLSSGKRTTHLHGLQGPTAMSVYFSSLTVATFPHQILNCFKIFLKTDARTF